MTVTPVDPPALSSRSRAALERRLEELETRVPMLERELVGYPHDPHTAAALLAAREEIVRLSTTLATAVGMEDLPDDPDVVEIGDTVTLRDLAHGDLEVYTIVHEPEARLDDSWISAGSPVGSAALGHRPGETIAVRTPIGRVRYEIVGVERTLDPEPRAP